MNNSNNPAMPLSGDAYQDFASYDGAKNTSYNPECQGLTKREMMAMHIVGHLANGTAGYDEQVKYKARVAVEYADELLKALED